MQTQASMVKAMPALSQQRITQGVTQRKIAHKMTLGDSSYEVFCAQFDPEDRYIALGYGDGAVRIYNMETGKLSYTLAGAQFAMDHEMPITCIRWRP
jgi:WD40 repeat protein